jgi:hypothetical protein
MSAIYYECQKSIEMARLGYLFANGKLTEDDARTMLYECERAVGCFSLQTISVESILDTAGYRWANAAEEIRGIAWEACCRVSEKWPGSESVTEASEDWALELIAEYAQDEGIILIDGERDETSD